MPNGRSRMHREPSTGTKTAAGLERSRRARWKHGAFSREARELLAANRRRWRELWALLGAQNWAENGASVNTQYPILFPIVKLTARGKPERVIVAPVVK